MSSKSCGAMEELLGVVRPWRIEKNVFRREVGIHDIFLRYESGEGVVSKLMGRARKTDWLSFEHLPLGGNRCVIHYDSVELKTFVEANPSVLSAPGYLAVPDKKYTHSVYQSFLMSFKSGTPKSALPFIVPVRVHDLDAVVGEIESRFSEHGELACLPYEQSAFWRGYLSGDSFCSESVGVRLLLARLQREVAAGLPNISAASQLRNLWLSKPSQLERDMRNLIPRTRSAPSLSRGSVSFPGPSRPIWMAILRKEVEIPTKSISLKLLLSKLQKSLEIMDQNQVIETLRSFLKQNKGSHFSEIRSIAAASENYKPEVMPPVNHVVWDSVLKGEVALDSSKDDVALNLLLSKGRQQIKANPGDNVTKISAARSVRDFLKQNSTKHQLSVNVINKTAETP